MATILNDMRCQIFEVDRWNGKPTGRLSPIIQDMVDNMLEQYKDKIIEQAAARLAERVSKTKKFREAMDEVIKDA
jgi:hypothetical protein